MVEPEGAKFKLPMPLLWQHDSTTSRSAMSRTPRSARPASRSSRKIAKGVTAEIDRAWSLIKAGLVPGLSIGFKPLEHEFIPETKGIRFMKWDWLEL